MQPLLDLDMHVYFMAMQHLGYRCVNVPQTTAESSNTHVQQSVDMSILFPTGLQCNSVQMAKLQQQVQDAWGNLLQDDIRHLYGCLHVRIHACMAARGGYTV